MTDDWCDQLSDQEWIEEVLGPHTIRIGEAMAEVFETTANAYGRGVGRHPERSKLAYADYLQTPHWQHLRRRMLAVAGYRCQRCGGSGLRLDVHHLTYDHLGLEPEADLQVLCFVCHGAEHRQPELTH